jgi:hypothetical protein
MLNSERGEIELSTDRQKADKLTSWTVKLANGRVRLAPIFSSRSHFSRVVIAGHVTLVVAGVFLCPRLECCWRAMQRDAVRFWRR